MSTPITNPMDFLAAIKKCEMFNSLTDVIILELLPKFKHLKLAAGQTLFSQGESSEDAYLVIRGSLYVFFISTKGIVKTVGTVKTYESIGELGVLSGESRSLTANAEVDSELISIPRNVFQEICAQYPSVLVDVTRSIITRSLKMIRLYEERESLHDEDEHALAELPPEIKLSSKESQLIEYVRNTKLFKGISDAYIYKLLPEITHMKLNAGEILFRQGDLPDYIYVLLSGKLSAVLTTNKGLYKEIGVINAGETVGELGTFSGAARTLSVGALENSELIRLSTAVFRQVCQDYSFVLLRAIDPIISRSVQTIKLLVGEKNVDAIAIFSICPDKKLLPFKTKLKETVAKNKKMKWIEENGHSSIGGYVQLEQIAKKEGIQHQVFFPNKIEDTLLQYLDARTGKFYLVVDGEKEFYMDEATDRVMKILSTNPRIKLNLILLYPNGESSPLHTKTWLDKYNFHMHHHVRVDNEKDIQRINRFINESAIGLVLSGGGSKGMAHLGVIKALQEKNISIDAIGGTSIGAMVAACYLVTESYDDMFEKFNWLLEKCYSSISISRLVWPIVSLLSSDPASKGSKECFGDLQIENLWIPFFCISSNLSTNLEVIHRTGSLSEALRTSASTPGLFPPVVINGQLHLDGGLLNNLPVDVMRERLGSGNKIIASKLSVSHHDKVIYDFPPVLTLTHTLLIKLHLIKKYRFPAYLDLFINSLLLGSSYKERHNSLISDILINPDLTNFKSIAVYRKMHKQLVNLGYNEALKALEEKSINND